MATKESLLSGLAERDVADGVKLHRECFAEFMGTAFLVFFGCGAVTADPFGTPSGSEALNFSFAFGTVVFVMAMAVGDISGGHFNPAVSLSLALVKGMDLCKLVPYWIAQFAGAFVGGAIIGTISGPNYNSGISLITGTSVGSGFVFEMMGTLGICLTVLLVALRPGNRGMHPGWPIGLAVCFGNLVAGPFTGAGINPARALGSVVYQTGFWTSAAGQNFWIYIIAPFTASFVAPPIAWLLYGNASGMKLPLPL